MAGEDTTVHALALGGLGQPATILTVPDPRYRDDQYRLFEQLGGRIESFFQRCLSQGVHPQIWVSSSAGASHLDVLAERLRANRENAWVRRCGELLSYATDRFPVAGQQALVTATGALRAHWATGQQPGEDEHLGALLAWIDPPGGVPIQHAVARAERIPMGVKTDPAFDRDVLVPLVSAYNRARREGATAARLAPRARAVDAALAPVARRVYDATQHAVALLQAMRLPPLPDLAALERREADEFQSFMGSRDAGYFLSLRDKPKAAVFKLSAREDAVQNAGAALLRGDRVARARGRLAGRVVFGVVSGSQAVRAGVRKVEHRLTLRSRQRVLHVRRGDTLCWTEDPRLRFVVLDVQRRGHVTHLSLVVTNGQRAVGVPADGAALELLPGVPDWSWLFRVRVHLKDRLRATPWTHDPAAVPAPAPATRRSVPLDPLAAVEALR
ncbi:MAG: hypothetical protein M3442_15130, partial [Chloroflexota bacterium]|nr:hypothetical protein [Chloroflexota bacterium]